MFARNTFTFAIIMIFMTVTAGSANAQQFFKRRPKPIRPPAIAPDTAGKEAMTLYDKNEDGIISGDELDASPALKASLQWLDKNEDDGISADEIAHQIKAWRADGVVLCTPIFQIAYGGKPVKSGEAILTPEPFLGDAFHVARGTIIDGVCSPACDPAVNPENLPGLPWGFYTVTFSEVANAPEKMGVEVSNYNPQYIEDSSYKLELKTAK